MTSHCFGSHLERMLTAAVNLLETDGSAGIGLGQIFYGPSLETMFNPPGLPPERRPSHALTLSCSRT